MDQYDIIRLGNILAIQAEIEGMKADNKQRQILGESMAYTSHDFSYKAQEIREASHCYNNRL